MSPLTNIPPAVRNTLYLVSALVGLGLGATQVGYQAAEAGFPTWLKVALSVYAFLAGALGLTAAANTPSYADVVEGDATPPPVAPPGDRGATDLQAVLTALLIILVAVVIAALLTGGIRFR